MYSQLIALSTCARTDRRFTMLWYYHVLLFTMLHYFSQQLYSEHCLCFSTKIHSERHAAEIFLGTLPTTMEFAITTTVYASVGFSGSLLQTNISPMVQAQKCLETCCPLTQMSIMTVPYNFKVHKDAHVVLIDGWGIIHEQWSCSLCNCQMKSCHYQFCFIYCETAKYNSGQYFRLYSMYMIHSTAKVQNKAWNTKAMQTWLLV